MGLAIYAGDIYNNESKPWRWHYVVDDVSEHTYRIFVDDDGSINKREVWIDEGNPILTDEDDGEQYIIAVSKGGTIYARGRGSNVGGGGAGGGPAEQIDKTREWEII